MPEVAGAGQLECREATAADADIWDEFVESQADGRLGHLFAFGTILERTYSLRPLRFIVTARDGHARGEVRGVVQAAVVRVILGRRRFVSMPFHEYGGPLSSTLESRDALVGALRRSAVSIGASTIEFRGLPAESPGAVRHDFVRVRLTQRDHMHDEVFASPLRRSLLKAARCGVEVGRITDWPGIEREFIPLYKAGLRRIGGVPHRPSFFRNALELLGPRAQFWVARREGVPLVAMTAYPVGATIHVVDLVRRHAVDEFGAGDAIHWEIMQWALAAGMRLFDFGPAGSTGTRRYKLKWGGEIHAGYDVNLRPGATETRSDRQPASGAGRPAPARGLTRGLRRAGSTAFRHLPDPLWTVMGSRVRRWMLR